MCRWRESARRQRRPGDFLSHDLNATPPHRKRCEKQRFALLSQTLCELQAKKESKAAPKQAGRSTSTSDISAGGVKVES